MTKVVEAIYSGGLLRPTETLDLADQQRVRLIVETLDTPRPEERAAGLERLRERIERGNFCYSGPLPTRDELHDRV